MLPLILAAVAWLALHVVVAGPLRSDLVRYLGEKLYRGLFAAASAALLIALIVAYKNAPDVQLWPTPQWAYIWTHVCMVPAFVLLALSFTDSPTAVLAGQRSFAAHGVFRITRHPMLNAFSLWAAAHLPANGDVATLLLLAAILITALNGMASIDRKRSRAIGTAWEPFAQSTSRLPFVAIAQGRNRLALDEISWGRVALGIVLYLAALWIHGLLGPRLI